MTEKKSGIYSILNTVSGRRYVGSAVDIKQRWHRHRHLLSKGKHHAVSLQHSWLKHGADAFLFEVLEEVADKALLVPREQAWIDKLNSACPRTGFNISPTAGSSLGTKHSVEARAKMSAASKGRKKGPFNAEHREAIRRAKLGMRRSMESRAKQSASTKGLKRGPFSAEHKEALSHARKEHEAATGQTSARNKSLKMREAVRASKLLRYSTAEGRAELLAMSKKGWDMKRASGEPLGRPCSEETKLKMSLAKKGRMTPEHRIAVALSNKRRALADNIIKLWGLLGPAEFGPPIHS